MITCFSLGKVLILMLRKTYQVGIIFSGMNSSWKTFSSEQGLDITKLFELTKL